MDFDLFLILVLVCASGMLIGAMIGRRFNKTNSVCGTISVTVDESDGPYMFLFLDVPIEELASMDTAMFSVAVRKVPDDPDTR